MWGRTRDDNAAQLSGGGQQGGGVKMDSLGRALPSAATSAGGTAIQPDDVAAPPVPAGATDPERAAATTAWLAELATPDGGLAALHGAELRCNAQKGVCVFSSASMERDVVVASLQKKLTLSEGGLFSLSESYSALGSALEEQGVDIELRLAVFLILERRDKSSPAAGYVLSLPAAPVDALSGRAADLGDEDQKSSWGDEDQKWAADVAAAEAALVLRADTAEATLRVDALAALIPADLFTHEALRWALGNVYSRASQIPACRTVNS